MPTSILVLRSEIWICKPIYPTHSNIYLYNTILKQIQHQTATIIHSCTLVNLNCRIISSFFRITLCWQIPLLLAQIDFYGKASLLLLTSSFNHITHVLLARDMTAIIYHQLFLVLQFNSSITI